MTSVDIREKHASWIVFALFLVLAGGIIVAAKVYYDHHALHYREEVAFSLSAIADLKAGELLQWRTERLGDGSLFSGNANFCNLVQRFLFDPGNEENRERIRIWLLRTWSAYGYDRVFLLDAEGNERFSIPASLYPGSRIVAEGAREALHSGKVTFQDFYRDEHDRRIYLTVLAPLPFREPGPGGASGAVLALRIDPEQYLYPFISRWPVPSATGETLIVRREADSLVFLNELRFQAGTALTLRQPLTKTDLPATKAVLGKFGVEEGVDYRGEPVLAATRPVPESPWFLVARMDLAERDAPLREQVWIVYLLVGSLLGGSGAGVLLLLKHLRGRFDRERLAAAALLGIHQERLEMAQAIAHAGSWEYLPSEDAIWGSAETFRIWGMEAPPSGKVPFDEIAARIPDRERERVRASLMDLVITGNSYEVEFPVLSADGGRERIVAAQGILHRNERGEPEKVSGVVQDVTDLRRKERELEEKNAELERFVYLVSHDLKSPLVTIKTFLGYLEQDVARGETDQAAQDMTFLRNAADKMGKLLDELLQISRIGRMLHEPETVPWDELVREALDAVAGAIAQRGVAVRVDPVLLTLRGDRRRLVEIWQNLLENAVKYMGDQPVPLVHLGVGGHGKDVVFFVCDNGMGIDPRFAAKIFGLFEKLDGKSEGSGLGLAIVKRIVELYGGKVWVESEGIGRGTCFRFTLPGALQHSSKKGGENHER